MARMIKLVLILLLAVVGVTTCLEAGYCRRALQSKRLHQRTPLSLLATADPLSTSTSRWPKVALAAGNGGDISSPPAKSPLTATAELATNLGVWYAVSALYNIYNKRALNVLKLPWTMALIQLGSGLLLFLPMWMLKLRTRPFASAGEAWQMFWTLRKISLFATIAHISGVMALGMGTVSFTQVVKAAEPLFTALLGATLFGDWLPMKSYAALMPVIAGVCMASMSELSFSWPCVISGIVSNTFSGARNVYSKKLLQARPAEISKLSAENLYSVLTLFCFLLIIPVTIAAEGGSILALAAKWRQNALTVAEIQAAKDALVSGMMFYIYNELSFKVLSKVNPVTHALANTMKRVVIILSSVIVFRNPMTTAGKVGSALAMLGTLLYSLAR